MMKHAFYKSSLGLLKIGYKDESLVTTIKLVKSIDEINEPSVFSDLIGEQINEYLNKKRTIFDFKYELFGTPFQKKVWESISKIPYGKTLSYKELAISIGNSNASRAVGKACGLNPVMIVVPCHRVIGSNKNLTGYAGGLDIKKKLLEKEQSK